MLTDLGWFVLPESHEMVPSVNALLTKTLNHRPMQDSQQLSTMN